MAFRAFGTVSIGGRVNVSRRRRGAVVGDGNGRRFAAVAFGVGDGVLHRFRVAGKGRLRGEGHFAARRIDFPFAFARDFQGRHRLVGRRVDQFDALRIKGVVALRVAVVGKDIDFDRLAFRAFGTVGIGGRVNVSRRRGAAVVGDGNGRRFAGVTVFIGDGVLHRFRVAGEGRLWREGHFAGRRVDFPFAFARDFQRGHRLVGGRIDQFDALRIEGVVALRVTVVGENIDFYRLALRAFGTVSIGGRVNVSRRRGGAVGIGDDVSVRAGVGAVAVVCLDGAAVFHCLRSDGHFARRRVNGHAARQCAFRDPFTARVFGEAHAMRLALFVGVVDVQRGRLAVRGDDYAAFVRRVFRHCRRVDAARLWLRIWTRIRVRAWAWTGIGVRVRVGLRRGVVVVGDDGGFHAAVAAVAVLRGHT